MQQDEVRRARKRWFEAMVAALSSRCRRPRRLSTDSAAAAVEHDACSLDPQNVALAVAAQFAQWTDAIGPKRPINKRRASGTTTAFRRLATELRAAKQPLLSNGAMQEM